MLANFLRLIHGFILVIGPKAAGKTSILRRLVTDKFEDPEPTLGYAEEYITKIRVIEIGGQANFQEYWPIALAQNPVHIFFVIDITQENDFDQYLAYLEQNASILKKLNQKTTLCANKNDLVEELPSYFQPKNSHIICSAKDGEGMLDILEAIGHFKDKAEVDLASSLPQTDKKEEKLEDEKVQSLVDKYDGKF